MDGASGAAPTGSHTVHLLLSQQQHSRVSAPEITSGVINHPATVCLISKQRLISIFRDSFRSVFVLRPRDAAASAAFASGRRRRLRPTSVPHRFSHLNRSVRFHGFRSDCRGETRTERKPTAATATSPRPAPASQFARFTLLVVVAALTEFAAVAEEPPVPKPPRKQRAPRGWR